MLCVGYEVCLLKLASLAVIYLVTLYNYQKIVKINYY